MIFDAHEDLRADAQVALHEDVESVIDRSFGGVFDRDHPVVGVASGDGVEDIGDSHLGGILDTGAKLTASGLVGVGGLGAKKSDGQIFFESEGRGHDLPVDRSDGGFGEEALEGGIFFEEGSEEHFLSFGSINFCAFGSFDHSHFVDQKGPLDEHLDEGAVDGINFLANLGKVHAVSVVG